MDLIKEIEKNKMPSLDDSFLNKFNWLIGKKESKQKVVEIIHSDYSYYPNTILGNYSSISFLLTANKPVKVTETNCISIVEAISKFGGYLSIITVVFITFPITFLSEPGFINHMVKYLFRKSKLKRKNHGKEIDIDEIKKQYLKRVSHAGIFDLHDAVEALQR